MTPPATMYGAAKFSDDDVYRFALMRRWNHGPALNFVMLNPSTADATTDDATIRRCIDYAKRWGFGALYVTNLFAFRATDPAELRHALSPIGPGNDRWIDRLAHAAERVVCGWGANPAALAGDRHIEVFDLLPEPHCVGTTRGGLPRHPLYVKREVPLVPYEPDFPWTQEQRISFRAAHADREARK